YDNTLNTVTTMGWVASWDYAQHVPSEWGKGFWSIPRNLELKTYPEGLRMIQKPHSNLEQLRKEKASYNGQIPQGSSVLPVFSPKENVDRKSTRLNSSHVKISYAVFCLKKKR